MKKIIAVLLSAWLICLCFSACGQTAVSSAPDAGGSSAAPDDSSSAAEELSDDPYAALDLREPANVVMYVCATEPNAMAEILSLVNERTKKAINTTMELYFIPSSERATKYPLVMAGGDTVDLIFTANYCYYKEQVEKGGFKELTEDFLKTYMPVTWATLPDSAWKETYINGKIYMVPRNTASIAPDRGPTINMEIAEKYGYPAEKINSYADFDGYLRAVGDNEAANGMYAFYASSSSTLYQLSLIFKNNLLNNQAADYMYYAQMADPAFEHPFYLHTSDYYKEYCLLMAEYAKAGVWPSDAVSNTNSIATLFANRQSATSTDNFFNGINSIANYRSKGIRAELFDIFPEGYRILRDSYIGDGMAIPSFCKNPERAAVLLDYIKTDWDTNMLLAGGVEGRHYFYNEESNTVTAGPESGDYTYLGWNWGIFHADLAWPATDDPRINAINQRIYSEQLKDEEWPYWGFNFDYTPVAAEWAVISALVNEYGTSFNLGLFGDETEKAYEEFAQMLKNGGLDKYVEEWNRQRSEFLANQ